MLALCKAGATLCDPLWRRARGLAAGLSETGNKALEAEGETPVKGGKEEGEICNKGDGLKEPTDEEQKKRDAENKKKRRKILQEQKQKELFHLYP